MKKILFLLVALLVTATTLYGQRKYAYETVPGDPLNARIYTLDNGLKVYLTVYKDAPRIQTYIVARVGSKNDPKETTGLAHYLEHLMFKGTPNFGTKDWTHEQPLLDEIERLFEVYRMETDPQRRAAIYHQIDSFSYEASKLAIPNEYDKMMKFIGSQGTNAATSYDFTYYIENIPSNQLENWLRIQADRFTHPILRLFHTELETVYEEKNMSLTNDGRLSNDMMLTALYPNHPYGQQTTLGTTEHLKNPSISNIKAFYNKYYVPNNMAIFMSGDFDFNNAIALIDNYFGGLVRKQVPEWKVKPEAPITAPVVREVVGQEAEFLRLAFRIDAPANSKEILVLTMLDNILSNGKAGLIDLNLNQKQLVQSASSYPFVLCDNSAFVLYGKPKAGQTLDEVKDLLLQQVELVKQGQFDDGLIQAAINNMKMREMRQLESNSSRAMMMANAFMNNIPWKQAVAELDEMSKITKQDIVDFAKRHFNNNYVVVYKRQGTPPEVTKVVKPAITPIVVNRDDESAFFKKIKANKPQAIAPVFADFSTIQRCQMTKPSKKNPSAAEIYAVKNVENDVFSLTIRFDAGELTDLRLPVAARYFNYLGTALYSSEQIKQEFYKLASNFNVSVSDEHSSISIQGLNENFKEVVALTMHLLNNAQPDEVALQNMVSTMLKQRHDAKGNQAAVLNALRSYGEYGPELVKYSLSEEKLKSLTGAELIELVQNLLKCTPTIMYYGPSTADEVKAMLLSKDSHTGKPIYQMPKVFGSMGATVRFYRKPVTENVVYFAPYNAKQSRVVTSTREGLFDKSLYPVVSMYNQYFGGSMNAIVFQELREKRSLAYTATSAFVMPSKYDDYMYNYSFIGTQNDKVVDALDAFNELFDDMPLSQAAFDLAKEGAKTSIETNRITKGNILNTYFRNKKLGYDYDYRKDFYEAIDHCTLEDIANFNKQYIKGKPKTYMILSKESDMDFDLLEKKYGKVIKLTLEDIFGY